MVTPAQAGAHRPTSIIGDEGQVMGPRLRGGDELYVLYTNAREA